MDHTSTETSLTTWFGNVRNSTSACTILKQHCDSFTVTHHDQLQPWCQKTPRASAQDANDQKERRTNQAAKKENRTDELIFHYTDFSYKAAQRNARSGPPPHLGRRARSQARAPKFCQIAPKTASKPSQNHCKHHPKTRT